MILSACRSRCSVVASAGQNRKKTSIWTRFVNKRSTTVKENLSKLAVIGLSDVKDVVQAFKELDEMHKKSMESLGKTFESSANDTSTSEIQEPSTEPETIFEPSPNAD
jgi:DNA integrity scanning protein DisA with diadenylate cyclase activity